ncbi:MAG: hypothetical protein QMB11_02380 [Nonlabens sp.]|uniref:hypothetical protein n=1 Tax=Nonlabens sp. TaxID=1888209 RepID=UPI0035A6D1EA
MTHLKKLPERRSQLYWSFLWDNFSIIFSLSIYMGWKCKGLILYGLLAIFSSFFKVRHYTELFFMEHYVPLHHANYYFL